MSFVQARIDEMQRQLYVTLPSNSRQNQEIAF